MRIKKGLTGLIVGALMLGLLAGCVGKNETNGGESGGGSAEGKVKLTMWVRCPENGPQEVVDTWNADHPDIQVEYVRFVNDDDGNLKLDTALSTGQNVDLYVNYTLTNLDKRIKGGQRSIWESSVTTILMRKWGRRCFLESGRQILRDANQEKRCLLRFKYESA